MRFRWGDCVVDREGRSLTRAGEFVAVQPLVLDLLLLLLQNRSRVVADDVIRRELWPNVNVTDGALRRVVMEARRALGDDGLTQAQIRTERGRGLCFAPPVEVEDGPDTSFVGRRDLLDLLELTLEAVADGRGALSLLCGPAGIGKTRMLVELGARAEARGFRVLWGSGRAGAEGHAFHPWLDAAGDLGLRELLQQSSGAGVAHGGQLSKSLRDVRFSEFARALTGSARSAPLLLRLDDLQFADDDSLALLRTIAPSLRSARVWIAGTVRGSAAPVEIRSRDLQSLAAEASTQVLTLRGLDTEELRAVVARQLRHEVSADSAELLRERSAGNPFFALELASLLGSDERGLVAGPSPDLGALIGRRAALLTPDARKLLRAGAALGIEFDPNVLREAEGCTPRALAHALDQAAAAGLLEPPGRKLRRFAHPLLAEALYAELAVDKRAATEQHLRIGEALERLGRDEPFALARHFLAARPAATAARALAHVRAAAEAARGDTAAADADFWYGHAIALAEAAGESAAVVGDLLVGQAIVRLAVTGLEAARVPAERAAQLALAEDDRMRLSRAALEYAHRPFIVSLPQVVHWLKLARERPSGSRSLEARVASRLGVELALAEPADAETAQELLREGVVAARALGDPITLGRVLHDVSAVSDPTTDPRGWLARAQEVVRFAQQGGDFELEFRGLAACATGHLQLGDRAATEEILERCRHFVRERPLVYARGVTRCIEAMFALLDGRFDAARAAIDEVSAEASRGGAGLRALTVAQRFSLALGEGRAGEMIPLLERRLAQRPGLAAPNAALALAHALEGRLGPALTALGAVVDGIPSIPRDLTRLPTLTYASEAAFRARAPIAAAALEKELAPYGALNVVYQNAAACQGSVRHSLGWLAAARGRSDEAVRHFEAALEVHGALRSRPLCERSQRAIAEVRTKRRARAV